MEPDFQYSLHPGSRVAGWDIDDEIRLIRYEGTLSIRQLALARFTRQQAQGEPPEWHGRRLLDVSAAELQDTDSMYSTSTVGL